MSLSIRVATPDDAHAVDALLVVVVEGGQRAERNQQEGDEQREHQLQVPVEKCLHAGATATRGVAPSPGRPKSAMQVLLVVDISRHNTDCAGPAKNNFTIINELPNWHGVCV